MTESPKRARGRPRAFHDNQESKTIQSLDRALTILECLSGDDGRSLSELAQDTGQSPTTAYRVLSTFLLHDIVEFEESTQLWYIGTGAFRIGSVFLNRTNLLQRSRPIMQSLMRLTGETANLGIERGDKVLFVSQVETTEIIRAFFPPGTQSLMHASGIGKVLLAHYSEDRVRQIAKTQGLTWFTDKTITNTDNLLEELDIIRHRGFGLDDEENTLGMRCVSAPVFNAFGEPVAGLSISGPTFRLTTKVAEQIGPEVCAHARKISHALGASYD